LPAKASLDPGWKPVQEHRIATGWPYASFNYEEFSVKAIWNGHVIAESDDTVVVENNHYFPMDAVNRDTLVETMHTSFCPWKGTASYYSLRVADETNENAAWYYPAPKEAASSIKDRMAFWKGVQVTE
jgi:uncharacterized protein (DUF427 family)